MDIYKPFWSDPPGLLWFKVAAQWRAIALAAGSLEVEPYPTDAITVLKRKIVNYTYAVGGGTRWNWNDSPTVLDRRIVNNLAGVTAEGSTITRWNWADSPTVLERRIVGNLYAIAATLNATYWNWADSQTVLERRMVADTAAATGGGGNFPLLLPDISTWYDTFDLPSLVYDGSNRVQLVSDKSGNSETNALCLNGVAGNYARIAAFSRGSTGDITVIVRVAMNSYATDAGLIDSDSGTSGTRNWLMRQVSGGALRFSWWPTGLDASLINGDSTATIPLSNFQAGYVAITLDVDNGAGGYDLKFWTSTTGTTWNQLGTTIVGGSPTSVFDANTDMEFGARANGTANPMAGRLFSGTVYNGIPAMFGGAGGVVAMNVDFTVQAKLVTSFPASIGGTVTINTTGDFGARISGARDYVQMTAANMPVLTIAPGANLITTDGSNDVMRTPPFSLPQPFTRYTLASQVTWTSGDYLWGGSSGANTGALVQTTTTPQLNLNAGSSAAANTGLAVNTRAVITEVFNGASSSLGINQVAPTTGNAGAGVPNGLTLGASGASTPANFGNITMSEQIVYSGAHTAAQQAQVIAYLMRKWGVS